METSLLLAKIIGPFFLIVWTWMLFNWKNFEKIIKDFFKNSALMWVTMFFTLILWLLLITFHNIWEKSWIVIITILWWLTFIKWAFYSLFPWLMMKIAKYFMDKFSVILPIGWILWVLIWAYLTYFAYFI